MGSYPDAFETRTFMLANQRSVSTQRLRWADGTQQWSARFTERDGDGDRILASAFGDSEGEAALRLAVELAKRAP